ncbi:unnamed protein product, partial [Rotaria sp. Silwood2]
MDLIRDVNTGQIGNVHLNLQTMQCTYVCLFIREATFK